MIDRKILLGFLGGLLAGLLVGLFVLGWWLWPVQWKDAAPVHLQQGYRQSYLEGVACLHEADPNTDVSQLLGGASWNTKQLKIDLQKAYSNASNAEAQTRLLRLGNALDIQVDSNVQHSDSYRSKELQIGGGAGSLESDQGERTDIPVETFTISPSNHKIAHEDVFQEIKLYVGGGPVAVCSFIEGVQRPTVVDSPEDVGLRDMIFIETCGWRFDEPVRVTMKFPDGRAISKRDCESFVETGRVTFHYQTDLNDPIGVYRFVFEGENGILQHSVQVKRAAGPRLSWNSERNQLFLYNFGPREFVRVFAYVHNEVQVDKGSLVVWQEFQVDPNGQLIVQMQEEGMESGKWYEYAVLGSISGEVSDPVAFFNESVQKVSYVVANTGDKPLALRERNSLHSNIVREVASGTSMEVIANVREYGHLVIWWQVHLSDGTEGWVPDNLIQRLVE